MKPAGITTGPRIAPYILATAGHVDHGKSSIVRSITGEDPDRLPEEKARGITIDLGFAHWFPDHPSDPDSRLQIGIVDVPGHEDFVKNMVAGVGTIDAALLVVAADDGWMPQTQEHVEILHYLGVTNLVVALNKIDAVADEASVTDRLRASLQQTPFGAARIIPTSARTGRGLELLKTAILDELVRRPPREDIGKPRLSVDRAFTLNGVGTVVTGTLTGGMIARGDSLLVQPDGVAVRVRGLQSARREIDRALPGMRVALNLADIEVGDHGARRGVVVAGAGSGTSASVIDVALTSMPTAPGPASAFRVRDGLHVRVHHASQRSTASVRLLVADDCPTRSARLVVDAPIHVRVGDRLVLRSTSELSTLCGAIVLDPSPPLERVARFRPGSPQARLMLDRLQATGDVRTLIGTAIRRDGAVDRPRLLSSLAVADAAFDAAVAAMERDGLIHAFGEVLVCATVWRAWLAGACAAIDQHHQQHPEQQGIPIESLRAIVLSHAATAGFSRPPHTLWEALVAGLQAEGFVRRGATMGRSTHAVALPQRLRPAGDRCREQLAARPFDPPSRKELCPTDLALQALRFLIANGEAIELSPELVIGAAAFARAAEVIRKYLSDNDRATVSELKSLLGSSRRVMVPLLERMDRTGITRRQGDRRTLGDAERAGVGPSAG